MSVNIRPTAKAAFMLLIVISMSACSSTRVIKTTEHDYAPTRPESIRFLDQKPEDRPHFEIGNVHASGFKTKAEMHDSLREEAAAIGAEAVIITRKGVNVSMPLFILTIENWASAKAIRWGDPNREPSSGSR